MCRKNHMYGWCGCALGIGLLLGSALESELLAICLGLGLIGVGLSRFRQK